MFETLVDDLKSAPTRLREAPERIATRRRHLVARVRHRAHLVRGDGEERLWTLETSALEEVVGWLDSLGQVPVVSRVVPGAERLVKGALDQVTSVPIPGYAELNAKDAARAVRGRSRVDLLRVRRFEQAHRDRKTVYDAISRELARLAEQPDAATT